MKYVNLCETFGECWQRIKVKYCCSRAQLTLESGLDTHFNFCRAVPSGLIVFHC